MRVGLIGLGVMGRNHLRVLQSLDAISSIVVFDNIKIHLNNSSKVVVAASLNELLAFSLDYAVVALPTSHHSQVAIELSKLRIPTLIEKPLAANLEESLTISKSFSESNTFCGVGHVERFNSALAMLKQKLEEGLVGTPIQITTNRTGPFPNRISDVGVVRDLASHDIDLVMWLTGSRYSTLHSQIARVRKSEHEDLFLATGRLENEVLINHVINWLTPMKRRETTVLGQNGLLVADLLRSELRFYENGTQGSDWGAYMHFRGVTEGQMTKFAVPTREPLQSEHEAMIESVAGTGVQNICTLAEALEVMKVLEDVVAGEAHEKN